MSLSVSEYKILLKNVNIKYNHDNRLNQDYPTCFQVMLDNDIYNIDNNFRLTNK